MGSRNPKTNLEPEWTFVGGKGTAEKQQKKQFRDPSFPLHLVKEKMCHLDVFGLDWWPHFVSLYAPPWPGSPPPTCCVPWVWPSNPQRKANMEPNEFNFWGHQPQQIPHQIVTFVFLLLIVDLSISFLIC
jgi:hypothetical protein